MTGLSERERAFRDTLLEWGRHNKRDFPWRGEADPYRVFIAEVLLQRTLAQKVVPIYKELISRYPDFTALADADPDELALLLRPLGLQNRKSTALIKIAKKLGDTGLPTAEEELLSLPFVGRYAANATLCFAFNKDRAVVDVNVARIYARVFELESTNVTSDGMWEYAQRLIPEDQALEYNLALLDFGAAICTANNPACDVCPENENCLFYLA